MAAVVLCGVFTAICGGGVFGMVAQFPAIYIQAVMSGQGLSGLTASVVSMAAALANDGSSCDAEAADDDGGCTNYETIDWGSFAYFLVACVIFLLCIVGYLTLERAPFARYYDRSAAPSSPAYEALTSESGQEPLKPPPAVADYRRVLWAVRNEAFAVWFVFTITIGLFPAITAQIRPLDGTGCSDGAFTDATFTAFMFLTFNLVDLIGRSAAGFFQLISKEWLPMASIARSIFVPLFVLCNVADSRLNVTFKGTFWPIIFMGCMALSNGYVSTLAMIYGPQRVHAQDSEIAGSVMLLALTFGLFSGSMFSYLVVFIALG
jgi:equilibrative nucleoside transporter 1/2/3